MLWLCVEIDGCMYLIIVVDRRALTEKRASPY